MAFSRDTIRQNIGKRGWRHRARRLFFPVSLAMAAAVGGIGAVVLTESGWAGRLLGESGWAVASQTFPICAGRNRQTCVVDGDTFWLDGVKIRIADINTPEIGQPSCSEEAQLGRLAQHRLRELLSAGDFDLVRAGRDEDQYGRKLRVVERNGRSLGDVLVSEGLAHPWRGHRENWC
ncbi:nuclease homologue [Devosia crocina]|uniref:Nuclease homologue n=1 Tax=Devosia crocina TaxID=429728 RepID=A0A1I7N756_9HYPH|nr:thermonuclease family protein [Devosia crocina]SFV30498.1 nuclease homologue [Devosia crocina]